MQKTEYLAVRPPQSPSQSAAIEVVLECGDFSRFESSNSNGARCLRREDAGVGFGHVRAASPDLGVHQLNCHPLGGGPHTLEDSRHSDPIEGGRDELLFMHDVGGGRKTAWANFCLTDGDALVATRYASPDDAVAQSLYVGEAGLFVSGGGFVDTPGPEGDAATIVASEPLFEDDQVWREVSRNHLVTVASDGAVSMEPLELDVPVS